MSVKSKLAENLRIRSAVELVVTPHGNHIVWSIGGVFLKLVFAKNIIVIRGGWVGYWVGYDWGEGGS